MLSIRITVLGSCSRIRRVATRPIVPGMAQSITTTRGFRLRGQPDGFLAVARLADHDDAGSSSRSRRKPRRTSV